MCTVSHIIIICFVLRVRVLRIHFTERLYLLYYQADYLCHNTNRITYVNNIPFVQYISDKYHTFAKTLYRSVMYIPRDYHSIRLKGRTLYLGVIKK